MYLKNTCCLCNNNSTGPIDPASSTDRRRSNSLSPWAFGPFTLWRPTEMHFLVSSLRIVANSRLFTEQHGATKMEAQACNDNRWTHLVAFDLLFFFCRSASFLSSFLLTMRGTISSNGLWRTCNRRKVHLQICFCVTFYPSEHFRVHITSTL